MKIGYACLTVGVADTQIRTCRKANATAEHLQTLTQHNLKSVEQMVDYNIKHGIKMYRISSDIIPFGSDKRTNSLDWVGLFKDSFNRISKKINENKMRVSMHPGQYTVLNSPDEAVVQRAVADLEYHNQVLDALEVSKQHKIVLHIGGVYGDKEAAKARFVENYEKLSAPIKDRLVIENDDRLYTMSDVLEISRLVGIPVVYDNLHNRCNPSQVERTDAEWITLAKKTWKKADGSAKIHYSQQRPNARLGAHTETIYLAPFWDFYQEIEPQQVDIMLEVKDKNLSAVKCLLATAEKTDMKELEKEWVRYKYVVLSRSPKNYQAIRQLLKDKATYPVFEFYRLIEEALNTHPTKNTQLNGIEHVWGYFKKKASDKEKEQFKKMKAQWLADEITAKRLKN